MSILTNPQLLEKIFIAKSSETSKFPRMPNNYYTQYCGFVNMLRVDIYPQVDTGLAVNSEAHGYYTAHNSEHFDEVVRYAGDLLGASEDNIDTWSVLSPYELYVLLVAIRIHDVGNIHGRDDHEKKCFPFLLQHQALVGGDPSELKIIAKIAESHGGYINGNKDTIGELHTTETIANIEIRPRLIAATLRFADEICEHSGRAARYLLKHGILPPQSEVYHKYAAAIKGSKYATKEQTVRVEFELKTEHVSKPWGCGIRKDGDKEIDSVYLIDEILDRLEKMNRERKYCNMYTRGIYAVEAIRAKITIVDDHHDQIESIRVPDLIDTGYPDKSSKSLREQLIEHSGIALSQKYSNH